MAVGDSPFDAMAAKSLRMRAAEVLTGGFSPEVLADAGCYPILGRHPRSRRSEA
jgi:hypothetical protein